MICCGLLGASSSFPGPQTSSTPSPNATVAPDTAVSLRTTLAASCFLPPDKCEGEKITASTVSSVGSPDLNEGRWCSVVEFALRVRLEKQTKCFGWSAALGRTLGLLHGYVATHESVVS